MLILPVSKKAEKHVAEFDKKNTCHLFSISSSINAIRRNNAKSKYIVLTLIIKDTVA